MLKPILIYGAGDTGRSALEILSGNPEYQVAGFLDDAKWGTFEGYDILGSAANLASLYKGGLRNIVLAFTDCHEKRPEIYNRLRAIGFVVPPLLHDVSRVHGTATIGEGAMVFEFASVGSHAVIGPLAIIKAYSRVAYGAQLGENTVLAPYAYVGSYSRIGPGTVVLARGTVERRTNVGRGCVVYAHAYVNADMPDGAVARGVPAAIFR